LDHGQENEAGKEQERESKKEAIQLLRSREKVIVIY
jgi:hypothetical protein